MTMYLEPEKPMICKGVTDLATYVFPWTDRGSPGWRFWKYCHSSCNYVWKINLTCVRYGNNLSKNVFLLPGKIKVSKVWRLVLIWENGIHEHYTKKHINSNQTTSGKNLYHLNTCLFSDLERLCNSRLTLRFMNSHQNTVSLQSSLQETYHNLFLSPWVTRCWSCYWASLSYDSRLLNTKFPASSHDCINPYGPSGWCPILTGVQ